MKQISSLAQGKQLEGTVDLMETPLRAVLLFLYKCLMAQAWELFSSAEVYEEMPLLKNNNKWKAPSFPSQHPELSPVPLVHSLLPLL